MLYDGLMRGVRHSSRLCPSDQEKIAYRGSTCDIYLLSSSKIVDSRHHTS